MSQIISVHHTRRAARAVERKLQATLDGEPLPHGTAILWPAHNITLEGPIQGVRVRKAGLLQWVVETTEHQGH